MPDLTSLYGDHVRVRRERAERVLAETGFEALLLDSGEPFQYFADDMDAPHHEAPHFAHWTPLAGPHHLLLVRPGEEPLLVRVAPEDYWYEQAPLGEPFWKDAFDVREVGTREEAWAALGPLGRTAYVGDSPGDAGEHGLPEDALEPAAVIARLDWDRSYKTAYEVACLEEAERMAARGHHAAREVFQAGGSELDIHHAYVAAVGCVDKELPYESIVGLDEKGAILHYTGKRTVRDGKVLLIDAGARHLGYASDITRTWTTDACDGTFRELVEGMDALQQTLCNNVRPGLPYPELHHMAHVEIGRLLRSTGLVRVDADDAVELGLTRPFIPHGLGHFLGLQVHDVAGHQRSPEGGTAEPPDLHPFLRTTRTIEEDQVFTIEPGLYFIEMLLRPHREGDTAKHFDWELVDRLTPCGGIRIEDNVLVTADGHRNLTRPLI
jgi:Xaa-Pro dipeptidase